MDTNQPNALHRLLLKGRRYYMPKGQVIQSSNERYRSLLNLVGDGYVKRYGIGNDGSLAVQAIYGPDYVFPLTLVFKALFDQDIYESSETIYYETMVDSEIYSLDVGNLVESISNDPMLYRDLLIEAGVRINSNLQGLENLSLRSSYKRTAHQIVYYARQFGEEQPAGAIRLKMALTQQDLADILSLTRETVSVNMQKLHAKRLIRIGRHIVVPDLKKLEEEAFS